MQAHPWNESFDWQDHDGPFTTLTPEQVKQFDEEGFVVVPDLVDADTLAEVRDDLDRLEAEVDAFLQTREDGRFSITETGALTIAIHAVTRSEKAKALSAHPAILGLCADLIGPDVRLYWDQAVYKKTEKPRRVPWHQDNGYTYVEPQEYLTVWLALTDATEENGCPEVAPGAHRHGTLLHHYIDPLGWECLEEGTPVGEGAGAPPAARWCSARSPRTAPARTSPTRSARRTSSSTARPTRRSSEANRPRGPPVERVPCTAPERQYEVLRGGEPVLALGLAPFALHHGHRQARPSGRRPASGSPGTRRSGTTPAHTGRSMSSSSSIGPPVRTLAEPSSIGSASTSVLRSSDVVGRPGHLGCDR